MAFSTLLACLRVDKPNADLLAVVRDTAERHRSAVIGLVAKQAEAHAYAGAPVRLSRLGTTCTASWSAPRRPSRSFARRFRPSSPSIGERS